LFLSLFLLCASPTLPTHVFLTRFLFCSVLFSLSFFPSFFLLLSYSICFHHHPPTMIALPLSSILFSSSLSLSLSLSFPLALALSAGSLSLSLSFSLSLFFILCLLLLPFSSFP